MNRHIEVAAVLIDIEAELRGLGLWDCEIPPEEALLSTQPFCYDTLNFSQWLQFVLLPRMHELVEQKAALPDKCGVAPMAEVWFAETAYSGAEVISQLRRLDAVLEKGQ